MYQKIIEYLNLNKPLVIFDLETTGVAISMDRIIELAYIKIFPNGRDIRHVYLFNPDMNIPEESTVIHGISDNDVINAPFFREKAREIYDIFNDCYYGGFNVMGFDLPLLKREFVRVGIDFDYSKAQVIDSKTIYHFMEPRTLSAAYKFYCGKEHVDAHTAMADIEVSAEVLHKQLERYEELRDWDYIYKINHLPDEKFVDIDRKFYWRNGEAYFAFSKFRDTPLTEVARTNPDFLHWILGADFPEETKQIVARALDGEFPKKELAEKNGNGISK